MAILLILSFGSLVGTNILDAVEAFRPGLRVLGVNSAADAPNYFQCEQVFLASKSAGVEAFSHSVLQIMELVRPDAVMAGRDDYVPEMAVWREQHHQ